MGTDLVKIEPKLIEKLYEDIAQPGVKQVGLALESIFGLITTATLPLKFFNEKANLVFKNNIEKYRKRLETIPIEQIADVPKEISSPIIEKLQYVDNPTLSDLYINLLTTASKSDTIHLAHPSFTSIIAELSPYEARILKTFHKEKLIPYINVIESVENGSEIIPYYFFEDGFFEFIPNNDVLSIYINNLLRLRLIQINPAFDVSSNHKLYRRLENLEYKIMEFGKSRIIDSERIERYLFSITPFGYYFLKCCNIELVTFEI